MLNVNLLKSSKIMIVDDNSSNILLLERILDRRGYINFLSVLDAREVLTAFEVYQPDLIILDLHMPHFTGYELLEQILINVPATSYLPILVFTADITTAAKQKALALGASDFLTKPGDAVEIILRVENFLRTRLLYKELEDQNTELEKKVCARTYELELAQIEILNRLAKAAEFRDDETGEHTRRVGNLSAEIAVKMGLSDEEVILIRLTAPLHDLGKIGVQDAVLLKPDKLTEFEFELMKKHTQIGANILSGSDSEILKFAENIAKYHHEKWNGNGYLHGLIGEDIPIAARIVAVADVFDALTHSRPYKEAWSIEQAIAEITNQSGIHFDPNVVEAFIAVLNDMQYEEPMAA